MLKNMNIFDFEEFEADFYWNLHILLHLVFFTIIQCIIVQLSWNMVQNYLWKGGPGAWKTNFFFRITRINSFPAKRWTFILNVRWTLKFIKFYLILSSVSITPPSLGDSTVNVVSVTSLIHPSPQFRLGWKGGNASSSLPVWSHHLQELMVRMYKSRK